MADLHGASYLIAQNAAEWVLSLYGHGHRRARRRVVGRTTFGARPLAGLSPKIVMCRAGVEGFNGEGAEARCNAGIFLEILLDRVIIPANGRY
jgi:hypothetical protein